MYAPGFYTGYDVKTLPGVRESIEQRQYTEADAEIARAAKMLEREAALVDAAAAELERLAPADVPHGQPDHTLWAILAPTPVTSKSWRRP